MVDRGDFKKHGLSVELVNAPPTSAALIAQILNGQVTAGVGGATSVISAVAKGLPVVITNADDEDYQADDQTAFAVMVDKDSKIGSFRQLEGKTVAVNSLKGSWEIALREAVVNDGGDPDRVKLLAVPFPDQATALKSGRVDAVSTLQPFISLLGADGMVSIGDPQGRALGHSDSVGSVTFMSKKYLSTHQDAAKTFVKTMAKRTKWCNKHPREMRRIIAKFTKVDRAVVNQAPVPRYTASLKKEDVGTWARLLHKYGVIDEAPSLDDLVWSGAPS